MSFYTTPTVHSTPVMFNIQNTLIEHTHYQLFYTCRTVIEFYVLDTTNEQPYLASYIVNKLDESSVFRKLNDEFSIMGIETKGILMIL